MTIMTNGQVAALLFIAVGVGILIAYVAAAIAVSINERNRNDADVTIGDVERATKNGTEYLLAHFADVLEEIEYIRAEMLTADDFDKTIAKLRPLITAAHPNVDLVSDVETLGKRLDKHGDVIRSLQADTDQLIKRVIPPEVSPVQPIPLVINTADLHQAGDHTES